jgi:ABC-type molybdate transport system substrate-binding protein
MTTASFARYVGIDYSGAETSTASLKGLRVYMAEGNAPPVEVPPSPSLRKYWTRRGIAEWLVERLAEPAPTLVGIDHGFSFPLRYFEMHGLKPDWPTFLDDFQRHWPTDEDHTYVDFIRDGVVGNGAARSGNAGWRRLTEEHARGAKSVFHFDVPGSVAKSTHAGIPWLRFIRQHLGDRVHFWPFDGWNIPAGRSAVAEVYPALWKRDFARADRTDDQHDAYCVAEWLLRADRDGSLARFLKPHLTPPERRVAQVEGWILGVVAPAEIKVIASNAVKEALAELAPGFEKTTGHKVTTIWGGTLDITQRIRDGEVVDVVILAAPRIDDFIKQGRLKAGSRVDIARSGIGVAVRAGARKPDISSGAALRTLLLAAKSVVLSSGPSSVYLAELFQKMGIADAIKSKVIQIGPGLPVGMAVARGEGEIGFTQVSELLSAEGIAYVGPLPADVQHITVFSAGIHAAAPAPDAARALLKFLSGPHAAAVIRRSGMEPARTQVRMAPPATAPA